MKSLRSCSVLVLAFLALAASAAADPRNVVVILMDDVGTDFLELYDELNPYTGDAPANDASGLYVQSPRLDELASLGVTFLNAYAMPVCSPTRACITTGNYPVRTGVGTVFRAGNLGELQEFNDPGFAFPTLAERAQAVGYDDVLVGKWHLGMPTADMSPLEGSDCYGGWSSIPERGKWSEWMCVFNRVDTAPVPTLEQPGAAGYENFLFCRNFTDHADVAANGHVTEYATTVQFGEALDWCNERQGPFLCFIAPNAAHAPWKTPAPPELVNTQQYLEGPQNAFTRYAGMLEAMDTEIGRFLDGLEPSKRENTLFVVLGDNGTEKVCLEHARAPLDGPEDGSGIDLGATYQFLLSQQGEGRFKRTAFEKGIRVPLIVAGAGVVHPGRTSRTLVDVTDVFRTVCEAMGAEPGDVHGHSFTHVLEDVEAPPGVERDYVYAEHFAPMGPVRADVVFDLRVTGCSLRIPDAGRFKVVRDSTLSGDLFYRLEDAQGVPDDPWEMNPLPYAPGDPFHDEYLAVLAKMQEIEDSGADTGEIACGTSTSSCPATANSTGHPAALGSSGTTSLCVRDLVLQASGLPPSQSGMLFYSPTLIEQPYGDGVVCVGGAVRRLGAQAISGAGELTFAFDPTVHPGADGSIQPGETLHFQLWYRDPAQPGGSGFNFSEALSLTFCP